MVEFLKRFLFTEVDEEEEPPKKLKRNRAKDDKREPQGSNSNHILERLKSESTFEGTQVFERVSADKLNTSQSAELGAQLKLVKGAEPGMVFRLGQKESKLGRRSSLEICLRDPGVSRDHALITFENFTYYIEDLASLNGTYLNGRRIMKQKLTTGDKITVGTTELEFRLL